MKARTRFALLFLVSLPVLWTACSPVGAPGSPERQLTLDGIVSATYQALTETQSVSGLAAQPVEPEETVTPALPNTSTTPAATATGRASPTPDNRPGPKYWSEWPIVPDLSARALEIYTAGIQAGNDPKVFSTIGDCQSEPNVFLGIYATDRYYLGESYTYLEETIGYFHDAFQLKSQGVRDGLSAPSALSPTWADPAYCAKGENPVQCELRLHKPGIVFVNLGTNWKPGASADKYEEYLRQIVDIIIAGGSLPVLSTKADNIEGDHSLNLATARVAYDYDIPLWNFWLASQSLPNNGLDGDRENIYLTPDGWDRRNFTGLQVLDAIRRSTSGLLGVN